MRKLLSIAVAIISFSIMACSSTKFTERDELLDLEKKGYSIHLDASPVNIGLTYLNETNISEVEVSKVNKYVNIHRRNRDLEFRSVADLLHQKQYNMTIGMITVDGIVLDSVMIRDAKFEDGAVRYLRLLTEGDYEGREFDDLPQVKRTIGTGILLIGTR